MERDIDNIIARVKESLPTVDLRQLEVKHPGVDDDGIWFFRLPGSTRNIQIESSSPITAGPIPAAFLPNQKSKIKNQK